MGKNIVCLIDSFNSGGAQKQMVMLVNGLCESNKVKTLQYHDINFFSDLLNKSVFQHKVLKSNKLSRIFHILKVLYKERPDIIISFLTSPNNYAALYKMIFFWRKTTLIVGERNLNINKLTTRDLITRFSHFIANFIVCNSDAQKNNLQKIFGEKVRFFPNGTFIDKIEFKNITNRNYHLIVSARFVNQKNPMGLLKALKNLSNIHVYWYGEIFKEHDIYKESIEFIKNNNLKNFHFKAPTKDILSEMLKYDALILPSFYEGCPNAIIDAMLVGLPVLASNVSDNQIYLEHQKEFLFDPNNTDDIQRTIKLFYNTDIKRIKAISENNITQAKIFFDPKKMILNYIRLF
ncbi:glycosyltransferase [Flavobacteriales bacterium]|nr:glycosyltransferase [Flavobacteriales bacterium]